LFLVLQWVMCGVGAATGVLAVLQLALLHGSQLTCQQLSFLLCVVPDHGFPQVWL
jgi:hypothetical protein